MYNNKLFIWPNAFSLCNKSNSSFDRDGLRNFEKTYQLIALNKELTYLYKFLKSNLLISTFLIIKLNL